MLKVPGSVAEIVWTMDPNSAKACDAVLCIMLHAMVCSSKCSPMQIDRLAPGSFLAVFCNKCIKKHALKNNNLARSSFFENSLSILTPYTGLCWPYGLLDMKDFAGTRGHKISMFPQLPSHNGRRCSEFMNNEFLQSWAVAAKFRKLY